MREYYVYKHTCPNGKVYIGITCRDPRTRWGRGSGYKTQTFDRAVKKFGWDNICHEIIAEGLSETAACEYEKALIEFYHATDPEYGYNMSTGGTYGNQISAAGRQRLADQKKIPVDQYTGEGELVASYESAKAAAEATGVNRGHISEAILGRRQLKTVGGYVWKRRGEPFEALTYEPSGKPRRKVAQYTKEGEFIREYDSIGEAKRETGAQHIRRVLNGENETSGGYVWKEVTR